MKIDQLKAQGHELLEEYIDLMSGKDRRRRAYYELQARTNGRNPHFSNMKNKDEVMLAIGTLKKMIFKKKLDSKQL